MAGFTVNRGAIRATIHSASGPGGRLLRRRADAVILRAKVGVPVDTGYLRSTIARSEPYMKNGQLAIDVGADAVYAAAIHEGRGSRWAPPSWRRRGPGPRRFLTNALSAAGGRQGR